MSLMQSYILPKGEIIVFDGEIHVTCLEDWVLCALLLQCHTGHVFVLILGAHENEEEIHIHAANAVKGDWRAVEYANLLF